MAIINRRWRLARIGLFLPLLAGFTLTLLPPVKANSAAQTLPFGQNWSNTGLITASDDWSGAPGIEGYLGSGLTDLTGADPQTITAAGPTTQDVIANQRGPATLSAGGVAEFELPDPVVALQGSGTADAPYLLISMDTTGRNKLAVTYTLRDLDGSADDAVTPVALQYRVGSAGDFINIPDAFVPDATSGPYLAGRKTMVWANLPAAAENQSLVQLRIITANAVGYDEWVGIDDIWVTYDYIIGPFVKSVTPDFNAFQVPVDAGIRLIFTEPVRLDTGDPGFLIDCFAQQDIPVFINSDPYSFSNEYVIVPYNLPPGDLCTLTVPFTAVMSEKGDQPLYEFSTQFFTAGCGTVATPIHEISGTGGVLDLRTSSRGWLLPSPPGWGYFIQANTPDANPATSEGMFVLTGRIVAKGDLVRLYGVTAV